MIIRCATFAAGAMLILAPDAMAQDVRVEKNISLGLASDAAAAAMQFCAEKGWKVSVTVVDRAGNVKVLLRSDSAGPHTADSSVGNEVIGAIAVAGAPGGDLDEQCADAGINKIRERLK